MINNWIQKSILYEDGLSIYTLPTIRVFYNIFILPTIKIIYFINSNTIG